MKYHPLFFSNIKKGNTKFVVCCSRDWRFKGLRCMCIATGNLQSMKPMHTAKSE